MRVNPMVLAQVAEPKEARQVAAKRTPAEMSEIRRAIGTAFKQVTGKAASAGTVDVLSAHVALETASGRQMFNNNFGGIKGQSPRGETARYGTREVFDGKVVHIKDGFRAYPTMQEGANDYMRLMSGRYGAALDAAESRDIDGFAQALKRKGYYTAPLPLYTEGLRHLADGTQFRGMPGPTPVRSLQTGATGFDEWADLRAQPMPPGRAEVMRVLDAVAASSARIAAPIES